LDGDYAFGSNQQYQGEVQQVIGTTPQTELKVNHKYEVSLFWASGQQQSQDGATTEQLRVSLCNTAGGDNPGQYTLFPSTSSPGAGTSGCSQYTAVNRTPSHGFTPWKEGDFFFVAKNTTETLDLLAIGSPSGLPPVVLLDGITLEEVPEPATWLLFGIGLAACAAMAYWCPQWLGVRASAGDA
jgi:hypothetical protein